MNTYLLDVKGYNIKRRYAVRAYNKQDAEGYALNEFRAENGYMGSIVRIENDDYTIQY